jgi:two-component sensor histidine kinase
VGDNGVGLPDDLDWTASLSLGLRLVRTLAKQLEATIQAEGGPGTVFSLTFRSPKPVTLK